MKKRKTGEKGAAAAPEEAESIRAAASANMKIHVMDYRQTEPAPHTIDSGETDYLHWTFDDVKNFVRGQWKTGLRMPTEEPWRPQMQCYVNSVAVAFKDHIVPDHHVEVSRHGICVAVHSWGELPKCPT